MAMANRTHTELLEKLRNSAALQRSIGLHAGADLLTDAATAIEDLVARDALHAAIERHPSGQSPTRVITTRDEAFALRAGAVVVNGPGKAFQVRTEFGGDRDCIDHATAAFLLPLTVIHEGE